ncbi:hypothetical protein ACFLZ1_04800 [Patescibacteria group bacterium]
MNTIVKNTGLAKNIWLIFAFMSILILLSSIFFMVFPEITFDISMEYPGSSLRWADLDENSQIGMRFLILRPFWDEIIFGILGLFCAWILKKRDRLAWNLGVVWGTMILAAGIALGLSELLIGKWPTVCMVTFVYSIIGVISLSCLFIVKKEFK